jgi:hypothetical protein
VSIIIGVAMLATFFAGMIALMVGVMGVRDAIFSFGFVVLATVWVAVGSYLITGNWN